MKTFLAVFFAILSAALVLYIVVCIYRGIQAAEARDSARAHARLEIESLKAIHCTPDIAEAIDRAGTERFEEDLDRSTLDSEEKVGLKTAFANGMELAGCGSGARAANDRQREEKERKALVKWQHRDGELQVYSWPTFANASVDGGSFSNTPLRVELAPGRHTVHIELTGRKSWDGSVVISPGQESDVEATLDKAE